ncbi:MAG: ADP-ribosylglycohydrolase family protein, partial [Victivallales bacterium]
KDNEDLGWFQAPANIGFMVLGLLYGEGDFGKSVCYAVNCGDDTDCTGATAGAILGIMQGKSGIPEKWSGPIGNSIQTIAIDSVDARQMPLSLDELTKRVIHLAASVQYENPELLRIGSEATHISREHSDRLLSKEFVERRLWSQSPYELTFDLPFGIVKVDYENGPEVTPGKEKKIKLTFVSPVINNKSVNLKWRLPEGWEVFPSPDISMNCIRYTEDSVEQIIIPGKFEEAYFYLPLEIRLSGRNNSVTLNVPFQKKGAVTNNFKGLSTLHEEWERHLARRSL